MLEGNLKVIKNAKLDIELLRRENEKLCRDNNFRIGELNVTIGVAEEELETNLKESGEKKLECKLGYCAYRVIPDKWEYDIPKLIDWAKKSSDEFKERYVKIIEELKKAEIKKDVLGGFLIKELPGLTITIQEPKFNYKIK